MGCVITMGASLLKCVVSVVLGLVELLSFYYRCNINSCELPRLYIKFKTAVTRLKGQKNDIAG